MGDMFALISSLIVYSSTYVVYSSEIGIIKEYCPSSEFKPECTEGEVVSIYHALYGAIKVGECIDDHFSSFTGCESDEQQYFDSVCSGLQSCNIEIPIAKLLSNLGCLPKGLSPYLEAGYTCIPVETDKQQCNSRRVIETSTTISIISSMNALATSCGQHNTPYIIQAKPGQHINITMVDFSWRFESKSSNRKQCVSYGYILDTNNDDVITICGNRERHSHVYTSVGHSVQALLEGSILQNNRFLIEYKAFGCPDIKAPVYGWVQKENNNVNAIKIGCYSSSETWILQCVDNSWLGLIGNCSAPVETTSSKDNHESKIGKEEEIIEANFEPELKITRNHVLIVTIGCLTLICCSFAIIAGIYCIRKYQKKANIHAPETYDYTLSTHNINGMVTYKPGNHSIITKEGVVMLPSYAMSMNRGNMVPDVPPRNPATDINYENCFRNQTNESESVKYYVLENPEENMGNGSSEHDVNHK